MTIPKETDEPLEANGPPSSATAHVEKGWDMQPLVGQGKGTQERCSVPRRGPSAYNIFNIDTGNISSKFKSTSAENDKFLGKCCCEVRPEVATPPWNHNISDLLGSHVRSTSNMSVNSAQPSTSPSVASSHSGSGPDWDYPNFSDMFKSIVSCCRQCLQLKEVAALCRDCGCNLCILCIEIHKKSSGNEEHNVSLILNPNHGCQDLELLFSSLVPSELDEMMSKTPNNNSSLQAQISSPPPRMESLAYLSCSTSSSVSPFNAISICDIHVEQHTYYCEGCSMALCNNCNISLHSQHTVINFQEAVEKATALNVQLQNESETVIHSILEAIQKTKDANDRVHIKVKNAIADVNETVRRFHHLLFKRNEELINDLSKILNYKSAQLQAQVDNLNTINEASQMIHKMTRNSLETNSPFDMIVQTHKAAKEMNTIRSLMNLPLEPCENDQVAFVPCDDGKLRNYITNLGVIKGVTTTRYLSQQMSAYYHQQQTQTFAHSGSGNNGREASSSARSLYDDPFLPSKKVWAPLNSIDSVSTTSRFPMAVSMPSGNQLRLPVPDNLNMYTTTPERVRFSSPPEKLKASPETPSASYSHQQPDCSLFSQPSHHQLFPMSRHLFGSPSPVIVKKTSRLPSLTIGGEGVTEGRFCRPWGLCCTAKGDILVADRSNNRIQVFDSRGNFLYKFGERGTGPGQFDRPAGICATPKGDIVVVDKDNHRVQMFAPDGRHLLTFGKKGSETGQFNYPWDVACSRDGRIAITDTRNHRVQVFDEAGVFLKSFGCSSGAGNAWKNFDSPRGVCFGAGGELLVTDFNNHRVVMIDRSLSTAKFMGEEGSHNGCFRRPQGIVCDDVGHIVVADSRNNRVQVIDKDGNFLWAIGTFNNETGFLPGEFDRPSGICLSPEGRIMLIDYGNNRVQVF